MTSCWFSNISKSLLKRGLLSKERICISFLQWVLIGLSQGNIGFETCLDDIIQNILSKGHNKSSHRLKVSTIYRKPGYINMYDILNLNLDTEVQNPICAILKQESICVTVKTITFNSSKERLIITKTYLFKYIEKLIAEKLKFFRQKNSNIFHISAQNIDCGYSLEPPHRGGSNEYPQSMFLSRNRYNNVYPCKPQFC